MIVTRRIGKKTAFKSSVFREEIDATMNIMARSMELDFERTVATWNDKPKFKKEVTRKGGNPTISVTTTDPIYFYVDNGTRVRRALMSDDWKSKTTPEVIGSGKGKGHVVFISKHLKLPGIKARHFSKNIAKKWKPEFQRQIKNALARAARRASKG